MICIFLSALLKSYIYTVEFKKINQKYNTDLFSSEIFEKDKSQIEIMRTRSNPEYPIMKFTFVLLSLY